MQTLSPPEIPDHEIRFARAYRLLADQGKADAFGGMESCRVYQEWVSAGRPADLERFIVERANIWADEV